MKASVFHDRRDALAAARENGDIFERVAVQHQQIRRRALANAAERPDLAQQFRIDGACRPKNVDGRQHFRAERELGRFGARAGARADRFRIPFSRRRCFMISRLERAESPTLRSFSMLAGGKPSFSPSSNEAEDDRHGRHGERAALGDKIGRLAIDQRGVFDGSYA